MFPSTAYPTTTSSGGWTDIAVGPCVVLGVTATNPGDAPLGASMRYMKGATEATLVNNDELVGKDTMRPKLPSLILQAGDKLQALTTATANWKVTTQSLVSAVRQISRARYGSRSGTWSTLYTGAADVNSLIACNTSLGDSFISAQILRGATTLPLFINERLRDGKSLRQFPVATMIAGDQLQVASVGAVDWVMCATLPAA